jgi:hypothetical protein
MSFNDINVIKVREHQDYNVKDYVTSFKTTLYFLMNFYVEMSLQMVENFNKQTDQVQFSCIRGYFCVICVPTSRVCNDYIIKNQEYIIQNKFIYFW